MYYMILRLDKQVDTCVRHVISKVKVLLNKMNKRKKSKITSTVQM